MNEKRRIGNIYMNIFSSRQEAVDACDAAVSGGKKLNLYFLNDYGFNIAQKDDEYLKILNRAQLLLNDGIGIKLGAKIWGIEIRENLNGTDLLPLLLKSCAKSGRSIYLLGSSPKNVRLAAEKLGRRADGPKIAGYHDGFFSSDEQIVHKINRSGADVLLVGMGMPLQEKFIDRHDSELNPQLRIAVGGFIDFASGVKPRAPKLLRKLNLEWLFRMILEPRRMWRRNVIGHLRFFVQIIRLKAKSNR